MPSLKITAPISYSGFGTFSPSQAPHLRPPTPGPPSQAPHLRPPVSDPPSQAPYIRSPISGPPISGPPSPHAPISSPPFQTGHLRPQASLPPTRNPHLSSSSSGLQPRTGPYMSDHLSQALFRFPVSYIEKLSQAHNIGMPRVSQ